MRNAFRPMPVTLGMVTLNEAKLLPGCLKILRPWVRELIVVDCGSRDGTPRIAERFGARVIRHRWQEDFSKARNVYLEEAHFPWILVLDAPERIASQDLPRLSHLIESAQTAAYVFPIRNYSSTFNLLSSWFPNRGEYPPMERASGAFGWFASRAIRFLPRSRKVRYEGFRHASVEESLRRAEVPIRPSEIPIHDLECLRGDRWIRAKQRRRLRWTLRALGRSPDRYETLLDIAKGLFLLGEEDKRTVQHLRQAVRLKDRSPEAHQLLGMVLMTQGRTSEAARLFRRALQWEPGNVDLHCLRGMAWLCEGRFPLAERAFQQALKAHPDHPVVWNGVGCLKEAQGHWDEAVQFYQKALKLHPQYQPARENLVDLMNRDGHH